MPGMALQFLNAVLYFAEKIFEALVVDLEKDEEMEVQASVSGSGTVPLTVVENELRKGKTTVERLVEVIEDIEKRRMNNDLMFARIREELDYFANQKKEDRIVVT